MGTRAICNVYTEKPDIEKTKPLVSIYRQFDGYPEGLGQDILDFVKDRRVVNGFTSADRKAKAFNGAGCLAAQLIADLKDGTGNVYIYPPSPPDMEAWWDIEFFYAVYPKSGAVSVDTYANRNETMIRINIPQKRKK